MNHLALAAKHAGPFIMGIPPGQVVANPRHADSVIWFVTGTRRRVREPAVGMNR